MTVSSMNLPSERKQCVLENLPRNLALLQVHRASLWSQSKLGIDPNQTMQRAELRSFLQRISVSFVGYLLLWSTQVGLTLYLPERKQVVAYTSRARNLKARAWLHLYSVTQCHTELTRCVTIIYGFRFDRVRNVRSLGLYKLASPPYQSASQETSRGVLGSRATCLLRDANTCCRAAGIAGKAQCRLRDSAEPHSCAILPGAGAVRRTGTRVWVSLTCFANPYICDLDLVARVQVSEKQQKAEGSETSHQGGLEKGQTGEGMWPLHRND